MRRLLGLAGLAACTAGATAVEFALILSVLLLFIVGSVEMAINIFIGSSIEAAVMEASRYGITGTEAGVSRADKVMEIVGDRTYGKPVGQYAIPFCDLVLAPVSFALRNASGEGDFFDGFPPSCPAPDDLDHQVGDVAEA